MSTFRIGIVTTSRTTNANKILRGIARYSQLWGPWTLILNNLNDTSSVIAWTKSLKLDGLFVSSADYKLDHDAITSSLSIPIITMGQKPENDQIPYIISNSKEIAKISLQYLMGLNHKNLGVFTLTDYMRDRQRVKLFIKSAHDHGLEVDNYQDIDKTERSPIINFSSYGEYEDSWQKEIQKIIKWLKKLPKPVAIFTSYDTASYVLAQIASENKMVIPDEISILGVGNDETICEISNPTLSSLAMNYETSGYNAAKFMEEMILGKKQMKKHDIYVEPLNVIERMSTNYCAVQNEDVAKALHHIRQNCNNPIQVDQVVKITTLSRRQLERTFKQVVGRSINAEISRNRLQKVADVLTYSETSIEKIAATYGFSTTSYMAQLFKKRYNMTPLAWRKKSRP